MKAEHLSDVAKIFEKAKGTVLGDGMSLSLSDEDLRGYQSQLINYIEFGGFKAIDHVPGIAHGYQCDVPINVVLISMTNAGKTLCARRIIGEAVARDVGSITLPDGSFIEDVLGSENMPDQTRAVIRIPLSDSFVLWDTPGLKGDNPLLGKITERLSGLDTDTSIDLPLIDTSHEPVSYQEMKIEDMLKIFPRERVIVIFFFDPTLVPFYEEPLQGYVHRLHEIYGNRVVFVASFKDVLDAWDKPRRDQRNALLKTVLGDFPLIRYSGVTGDGLLEIVKSIMHRTGKDSSVLQPYLNAEVRGSRLMHSLNNLSGLAAAALTSTWNPSMSAPRDIHASLLCMTALYASLTYKVTETDWKDCNGDLAHIAARVVAEEKEKPRPAVGFWEKIGGFFGNKYHLIVKTRYLSVEALCETCIFLYELTHKLEAVPSPVVDETVTKAWFERRFSEDNIASVLKTGAGERFTLHLKMGEALIDFWREFHPNSLDFTTRIGG